MTHSRTPYDNPLRCEISVKWPAARLVGPDVETPYALEFIRRTDPFLVGGGFTNNRVFEKEVRRLIGLPEDRYASPDSEPEDWQKKWRREELFKEEFGHVQLEHLGSHYVANAYIGGPTGPVAPTGKVSLALNFGKWPSLEEIESDLDKICEYFPELKFTLSVYGQAEESDQGDPSITIELNGDGTYEYVEPRALRISAPDVVLAFMAGLHSPMREQTWTIEQIDSMWGERIRVARAATERRMAEEYA